MFPSWLLWKPPSSSLADYFAPVWNCWRAAESRSWKKSTCWRYEVFTKQRWLDEGKGLGMLQQSACLQRWNGIKYIYSSTVLQKQISSYLYFSISILCYFVLHYSSERTCYGTFIWYCDRFINMMLLLGAFSLPNSPGLFRQYAGSES